MTADAALWLLLPVLPVCLYVAWSDLASMKIPNRAVIALVAIFIVIGPAVLPFADWAWRWVHLAAMLILGIALNAGGIMGAGDAKFIAAAAPYIALRDVPQVLLILSAMAVCGLIAHRIAKHSPLRGLAPHWTSWDAGRRFPMGFPLAATLCLYLTLSALAS